jgi:aryl-alcohol dehydrogenase-like predicted oxidoreductase
MHHVDRDCPWDETWQAFEQLGNQGKVVYVGSSNFAGWDIATACQEASKRGLMGLASEQSIYHLNNRMLELEVIPACRHYGLGLIPWSPLGGGLLGGALEKLESGRRTSEESLKEIKENRPRLERYEALCKQLGEPPAAIALAWLLHNPVVTAPIIGPRTIEQLDSTLRATEITQIGKRAARDAALFHQGCTISTIVIAATGCNRPSSACVQNEVRGQGISLA